MNNKKTVLFSDYHLPPPPEAAKARCTNAVLQRAQLPAHRNTSLWAQARIQVGYVGTPFWLCTAAVCGLFLFAAHALTQNLADIRDASVILLAMLCAAGPLFAAVATPVITRSHIHNMWELEESALHNLPRLTLLRMLICAVAALPAMLVLAAFTPVPFLPALVCLLCSFLLSCAACYLILGWLRGLAGSLACVGACIVLGGVFMCLWFAPQLRLAHWLLSAPLYGAALGAGALALCALLCFAAARTLLHKTNAERNNDYGNIA